MNKRYCSLDIAKFAFTMMVAVFHFWDNYNQPARGGFIAVEFFFIVSGFFLMKQHAEQIRRVTPMRFTWLRVKKYYPHYIFSFLMLFLVSNVNNVIFHGRNILDLMSRLINQLPEIFIMHGTIISDEQTILYNSATWYLSTLLIMEYILWAVLNEHESEFLTAAPVIILWMYSYMLYTLGTTNNWRTHVFGVFNYATLRAAAGMLLGALVYFAREKVSFHVKFRGGGEEVPVFRNQYTDSCIYCKL